MQQLLKMKPVLLFSVGVLLWASAAASPYVNARVLLETPSDSPEKIRIVALNGKGNDLKDINNTEGGKPSVFAGEASCTDKFFQSDLTEAVKSVLYQHPELVLEALREQKVELAELVEQASYLRQAEAEKERRFEELKQPKVPAIDADRPIRGNPQASITIVEYSDFECPFCGSASSTIKQVLEQYGDDVRFVYKHNPLNFHPMAEPAARYFEAIAMQDVEEAWRFHDLVFEQQEKLTDGESVLSAIVTSLNIDLGKLEHDLNGDIVEQRLSLDRDEVERFGFDGTPAFLINGVSLMGNQPKENFEEIFQMFMPSLVHRKS